MSRQVRNVAPKRSKGHKMPDRVKVPSVIVRNSVILTKNIKRITF